MGVAHQPWRGAAGPAGGSTARRPAAAVPGSAAASVPCVQGAADSSVSSAPWYKWIFIKVACFDARLPVS